MKKQNIFCLDSEFIEMVLLWVTCIYLFYINHSSNESSTILFIDSYSSFSLKYFPHYEEREYDAWRVAKASKN